MRVRKVVRSSDGFIGGLIREAFEGVEVEIEQHDLHQKLAHLAKHVHGKRNAPAYLQVEGTLAVMVRDGELAKRYAPSQHDGPRRNYGRTYYRGVA